MKRVAVIYWVIVFMSISAIGVTYFSSGFENADATKNVDTTENADTTNNVDTTENADTTNNVDTTENADTTIIAAYNAPDHVKTQADYVCDGTADETEIQAAIDAYTSGGIVQLSEGTFTMSAGSGSTPIIRIDKDNVILRGSGWNTILDFTAMDSTQAITVGLSSPVGAPSLLTLNCSNENNNDVVVVNGDSFTVGDIVKLYSDDVWLDATIGTLGELCEVDSVVGNVVTMKDPLYGGPVGDTKSYTVANNAALVKITPVKGVKIEDLMIIGNPLRSNAAGIKFNYAVDSEVNRVSIQDTIFSGIMAAHSLRGHVNNCRFDGINEPGLGYGFSMYYSSRDWYVDNCHFTNGRHATDLGGSYDIPGVPRNLVVTNCISEDMIGSAFSTHILGDYVTYRDNYAAGFADYGFSINCLHAIVDENTVTRPNVSTCYGICISGRYWFSNKGDIIISNNIINGYANYSIVIQRGANGVKVIGNTVEMGIADNPRILVYDSSYVDIFGNTSTSLVNVDTGLVQVQNSSYVNITNNTSPETSGY